MTIKLSEKAVEEIVTREVAEEREVIELEALRWRDDSKKAQGNPDELQDLDYLRGAEQRMNAFAAWIRARGEQGDDR